MTSINSEQFRSIFDRWSRLEDEKQATSDDLKDLFAEAKGNGFNTKAMRAAFRMKRKRDEKPEQFDELQDEVDVYLAALGTPVAPAQARDARTREHPIASPAANHSGDSPRAAEPTSDKGSAHSKAIDAGDAPAFLIRKPQQVAA